MSFENNEVPISGPIILRQWHKSEKSVGNYQEKQALMSSWRIYPFQSIIALRKREGSMGVVQKKQSQQTERCIPALCPASGNYYVCVIWQRHWVFEMIRADDIFKLLVGRCFAESHCSVAVCFLFLSCIPLTIKSGWSSHYRRCKTAAWMLELNAIICA